MPQAQPLTGEVSGFRACSGVSGVLGEQGKQPEEGQDNAEQEPPCAPAGVDDDPADRRDNQRTDTDGAFSLAALFLGERELGGTALPFALILIVK
jgi:hypothetical protein